MKMMAFRILTLWALAGAAWADSAPPTVLAPAVTGTPTPSPFSTPRVAPAWAPTAASLPVPAPSYSIPATGPEPIEKVRVQKVAVSEAYSDGTNFYPSTTVFYYETEYIYLGNEVRDLNRLRPVLSGIHDPGVDRSLGKSDDERNWGLGLVLGGAPVGLGGGLLLGLPGSSSPTRLDLGVPALIVAAVMELSGIFDFADAPSKVVDAIDRYDRIVEGKNPNLAREKQGDTGKAEEPDSSVQGPPIVYRSTGLGTDFYFSGKKVIDLDQLKSIIRPIQSKEADGFLDVSADDDATGLKFFIGGLVSAAGGGTLILTDSNSSPTGDTRAVVGLVLFLGGIVAGYIGDQYFNQSYDDQLRAVQIYNEFYHWPQPGARNSRPPAPFSMDLLALRF